MPYIETTVTCSVSGEKRKSIKERLGKAIVLIPGKTERFLMLAFNDNTKMYFSGTDEAAAFVEVKIFGAAKKEEYDALTAEITKIYADELGISPSRLYVKYEECYHWGWNGENF